MQLKSKSLALPVDSSFPMVLMAESNPILRSSTTQGKPWKPCFNFANGSCRYGDSCKYVHDVNAHVGNKDSGFNKGRGTSDNTTHDLLNNTATSPHTYYASPGTYLGPTITPPPGFHTLAQAHVPYYFTTSFNQAHLIRSTAGPAPNVMGQVNIVSPATQPTSPLAMGLVSPTGTANTSGHATLLPQAFTTRTLHDPTTGAWNMDTGASSHLNNSVTSLSTILNSCMYSQISVGDGHSIPVTNTGHSILSTPLKSLRLNNVLITPHIIKNLIFVCQFVRDNDCTIEFDSFGFSVKDFMTRRVLLRCDSTEDLYPVTTPSPIPSAFLVSQQTWH
ncbi:ribonuclease H-like domain-containing protein [Tanacetum coccineum]